METVLRCVITDIHCAMSQKEVDQHLEMGKKMLAAGQLADALQHYHAAAGTFQVLFNMFIRTLHVFLCYLNQNLLAKSYHAMMQCLWRLDVRK